MLLLVLLGYSSYGAFLLCVARMFSSNAQLMAAQQLMKANLIVDYASARLSPHGALLQSYVLLLALRTQVTIIVTYQGPGPSAQRPSILCIDLSQTYVCHMQIVECPLQTR